MSDFLLDAVAQFLKGDQWLEPVNAFMHANKLAFVGLAGPQESYSLQQHAVFVEFKDLAERLLEGIVQDLGCEPSTFVAALEEAVVNEAGGPKEEEVQLLVKTLLAYDDFHGFCALMQTYVEWNAVPSMPPDENEMQFSGADEFQVVDGAAAFDATKYFGSHEWILQEVVARSLLDAQASGQLGDDDAAYLPWADAIMMMKAHYNNQTTVAAYDVSDGTGEATTTTIEVSTGAPTNALLSWRIAERQLALESKMAAKMRSLEATLVHERLKVDLLVAQRLSERNAGMRLQMSALCQQSFSGSDAAVDETTAGTTLSAEDELCHLCDRMETIQVELKAIKKRCFGFKSVSQAHLDEIYLFLKEKIHFKHDLAQCESEIADFIFSRIQPSDSAIVPDLLQWLLLESEAHEVQVEVQSRSFLSPRAEAKEVDLNDRWVQHWSGDDGTYYYLNSVTGESRWDPPMSKDGEPIVGYWDNDNQWVPYAFLAPGDNPPVDMTADSKGDVTPLEQKLPPLETKPWSPSADLTDIETALGSAQSTHRDFTSNMMDVEASLQKVLQEHADESKKLEIALQVEHARQTQDIQRRKAQRRKERKVKKAAAHDGGDAKTLVAPPPPVDLSALNALSGCQINICLPEGGKFDLLNLLSEADERVRRERRGDAAPKNDGTPASLNATSLRYLAEKLAPTSKLIEIEDV